MIMAASKNELYSDMQQYTLNNIAEWENLLEHFVVHLTRRYDRRILEQWILNFRGAKKNIIRRVISIHPRMKREEQSLKSICQIVGLPVSLQIRESVNNRSGKQFIY